MKYFLARLKQRSDIIIVTFTEIKSCICRDKINKRMLIMECSNYFKIENINIKNL